MANVDIPFLSTIGKLTEMQVSEISFGSIFPITHPRFRFDIYVSLGLKHLFVVTFLHYCKKCQKIRQNRLTHLCVAVVNRLEDSDESQTRRP